MSHAPLSAASRTAIRTAQAANLGVYLSPFTAWEIGTLVSKGRLHLTLSPEVWFDTLLALPGVRLAALTPKFLSVQRHYREVRRATPRIASSLQPRGFMATV